MGRDAAIAVAGIVLVLAYLAWAWFYPFGNCGKCRKRRGRGIGSSRFGYSRCGRCGGSGERTRVAARAISRATGKPVRGAE